MSLHSIPREIQIQNDLVWITAQHSDCEYGNQDYLRATDHHECARKILASRGLPITEVLYCTCHRCNNSDIRHYSSLPNMRDTIICNYCYDDGICPVAPLL